MPSWESSLRRWTEAGLLDRAAAERIRSWEAGRPGAGAARWPAAPGALAWVLALGLPAAAATVLRGRDAMVLVPAAVWVSLGPLIARAEGVAPYLWADLLAVLVIAWGLRDRRAERVNLGIAGFALAVTVFYFSDFMDRLGRSASLIGLGLLFLGGGYLLERTRRRLLARIRAGVG